MQSLNNLASFTTEPLPVTQADYIALLEQTCKALLADEEQSLSVMARAQAGNEQLSRWGIAPLSWYSAVTAFHKHYGLAAGNVHSLQAYQLSRLKSGSEFRHSQKWIRGLPAARRLFADQVTRQ